MVDLDAPAVLAADSAVQGQPGDAGDRRQCLAAETEAGYCVDGIVRELGRCVPLQRQTHFLGRHSAAVVGDFDAVEPTSGQADGDARRTGIERVFDQLLEGASRALDHLARGDAIDELRRQPSY